MPDLCTMCPRRCGADREKGQGICGTGNNIKIARADLHFWEEPCISGKHGSGAVFFSGCSLHCIYCQNKAISDGKRGEEITEDRLCEIFFELRDKGAENINLVTGDHFIPSIARAVKEAKDMGFDRPFVFNCSGYESIYQLKMLEGLIDVYLPDMKYMESETAKCFSKAADYPYVAQDAIEEMVRQQPKCIFDERGLMKKGVMVRHLLLPGHVRNSKKVLRYLHDRFGNDIYISIMSQYTPMINDTEFPELLRRVKRSEYDRLTDYAIGLGIENAYIQDRVVAKESFIPEFDNTGVNKDGGENG